MGGREEEGEGAGGGGVIVRGYGFEGEAQEFEIGLRFCGCKVSITGVSF